MTRRDGHVGTGAEAWPRRWGAGGEAQFRAAWRQVRGGRKAVAALGHGPSRLAGGVSAMAT
ncbi:hypothetical protein SSPS47_31835 [Streptomyces sp. S4.7]|nr:hypothetical protein SSPS47_31835 [Streptomyces sp. S4.7]